MDIHWQDKSVNYTYDSVLRCALVDSVHRGSFFSMGDCVASGKGDWRRKRALAFTLIGTAQRYIYKEK